MPAACRAVTFVSLWGGTSETCHIPDVRFFFDAKKWRLCDEKNLGHTRAWRDSLNRWGCEPDDSGRSMASWLSRRSNRRRPGGRGSPWRSARGPKALLRRLRLRARLFRAAMLHPTRTLLGRMALARSPCRGLLLSSGSSHRTGDEMRTSDDAGGADQAAVLV